MLRASPKVRVAVLWVLAAGCGGGQASLPPAATPRTQPAPAPSQRAQPVPAEVDPEATAFPYPYPVEFLELNSQGQRLRMAYMDVPAEPGAAAAAGARTPAPPVAAEPSEPPAVPSVSPDAPEGAVEQPANPGEPPAGQAQGPAADGGRCIVLLHGKNFSGSAWAPTIDLLSKQGYRVIAPDQIGFGKSSKPGTYQYSFAQLARNTRDLLQKLNLTRCSVVGHSMGGMLAIRFALLYPAATERLILVNPIGLEDYSLFVPYRTVDEWFKDELKQTPDTIREYQRTAYYNGQWKPAYEEQIQLAAGFTRHADYARVAWASALTYDMIFTQPVVNDLPRVRVPTRLIIGLRDRTAVGRKFALPETAASMGDYTQLGKKARDLIPGAQLIELGGVGHVPQVEAFPAFRDVLLQFLR